MKKLVIFDGNSIMNRAFYGVRPLSNKEGLQTNAIYGYITIVKKHLDRIKPDYAAVAFDLREPTFRHKFYDGYKATRSPMKDELACQVPYIREISALLGLNVLMAPGFEADDILGTVSSEAAQAGVKSYVVTGDRDSFQLVNENTTVILTSTGADEEYTPENIFEKYGLEPRRLIDVKALAGDSSDNIPGVRGIGEKGAVKLISEAGSLDALYDKIDRIKLSDSLRAKLEEGRESAYMSRFLGEIKLDVPELPALPQLALHEIDRTELKKMFVKLEFYKLLKSFGLSDEPPAALQGKPNPEPDEAQLSLESLADEPEEELPDAEEIDAALLDTDGEVCLAYDGEDRIYAATQRGTYRITGDLPALMKRIRPVVFSYKDYCHLFERLSGDNRADGIEVSFDLSLAAYLANPGDNVSSLSRIALIYLKRSVSERADNPVFALGLYPELHRILSTELEKLSMHSLYYDIEIPLARTLARTEMAGFRVAADDLKRYGDGLKARMNELEGEIYEAAGERFNLNSPKQLSDVLFSEDKLNLPHFKKTKSGFSTDADTLEKLRRLSPAVAKILEYRAVSKLYGTYIEGLLRQVDATGRIHTSFLQTQTQTGRLSSIEPNLQNIPIRTPLGRELRRYFIAGDGNLLVDADYSQIELRILAHISGDEAFIEAFNSGLDIHARTASEIFHCPPAEVTPEMRKDAKAVNFGIVYGIGEYSLSLDLGVSRTQAAAYIERYFESYPKVREYLENTKKAAKENGYVTTLFGRRRYIPELASTKKPMIAFGERVAMNTPIQGTAADIIKLAMVAVDRRLESELPAARLIMQVHDELIIECPEEEAERAGVILKEEMEKAASFSVKLTADVGIGKSWFDAH